MNKLVVCQISNMEERLSPLLKKNWKVKFIQQLAQLDFAVCLEADPINPPPTEPE